VAQELKGSKILPYGVGEYRFHQMSEPLEGQSIHPTLVTPRTAAVIVNKRIACAEWKVDPGPL
jgi:hypothetical protein